MRELTFPAASLPIAAPPCGCCWRPVGAFDFARPPPNLRRLFGVAAGKDEDEDEDEDDVDDEDEDEDTRASSDEEDDEDEDEDDDEDEDEGADENSAGCRMDGPITGCIWTTGATK
jgi:hypothetical protein